jgi:glycolate oxidase
MSRFAKVSDDVLRELRRICGSANVITEPARLARYGHDQVPEKRYHALPEVVVLPGAAAEVQQVASLANREHIPLTPRGAGTGLSGGAIPVHGGICLSMERMNRILEIDTENLVAVVEPGVVTNALDEALRPHGLFFAGYPLSEEICFIGGNVAHNAGGGRAVKYGVTKRYITGLDVVTASGELLSLGGKRFKDVTGYDLVSLMVGSEGTLGIFTKVVIRLLPRPTHRATLLALFDDMSAALGAVSAILSKEVLVPSSVELMDKTTFQEACRALKETIAFEKTGAVLLLESDGRAASIVEEEITALANACRRCGAREVMRAANDAEAARFWKIRKQAAWVLRTLSSRTSIEDIVVPVGTVGSYIRTIEELEERYGVRIPTFGHAADGNFHSHPLKAPGMTDEEWDAILPRLLSDLYRAAAALGGTISGEHGIGNKRRSYLPLVMSPGEIDMLRAIKNALDPNGILNPGKIFDDAAG